MFELYTKFLSLRAALATLTAGVEITEEVAHQLGDFLQALERHLWPGEEDRPKQLDQNSQTAAELTAQQSVPAIGVRLLEHFHDTTLPLCPHRRALVADWLGHELFQLRDRIIEEEAQHE